MRKSRNAKQTLFGSLTKSPRAFRANFAGDSHSRWHSTALALGKESRQIVNNVAACKEDRAAEQFLGMKRTDERNR